MNDYIIKGATLTNIADAIRSKTGTSQPIDAGNFSAAIATIPTDPSGDCTATNADILQGKTAYAGGQLRTGTIPTKTSSDLSASGATVVVPSGYYASQVTKSISTGTVSATAYSNGNVHFNATSAGYVDGSKNTYKQYSTKAATTITPSTSAQTAISANTLATGAITVAAVANATAGNIKSGVSIAGVAGTYKGDVKVITTNGWKTTTAKYYPQNMFDTNNMQYCGYLHRNDNASIQFITPFKTVGSYSYYNLTIDTTKYICTWDGVSETKPNRTVGSMIPIPFNIVVRAEAYFYNGVRSGVSMFYFDTTKIGNQSSYENFGIAPPTDYNLTTPSGTILKVSNVRPGAIDLMIMHNRNFQLRVYQADIFYTYYIPM